MSLDVTLHIEQCEHCGHGEATFEANITHNLNDMAAAAGIYNAVWRPDEHGYRRAKDIIKIMSKGLADLKARPGYFRQFDADNGWGVYDNFVPWIQEYLEACERHPEAGISVSRCAGDQMSDCDGFKRVYELMKKLNPGTTELRSQRESLADVLESIILEHGVTRLGKGNFLAAEAALRSAGRL